MNAVADLAERLRYKVNNEGCWNWAGSTNGKGYGQMTFRGRGITAHKASYEAHIGPIPSGMLILHKCDNRACINPEHLYAGTYKDNRRDMLERSGWKHPYRDRLQCSAGHIYSDGSFRIAKDGSRVCKECMKQHMRTYRARSAA